MAGSLGTFPRLYLSRSDHGRHPLRFDGFHFKDVTPRIFQQILLRVKTCEVTFKLVEPLGDALRDDVPDPVIGQSSDKLVISPLTVRGSNR